MTSPGRLRLILTRHAKSDWADPTVSDLDRPLNARGRRAALALGDWLASRGYEPEEVICSNARRSEETWQGVERVAMEVRPEVRYDPRLYHAAPETMLALLREASAPTVMMIGHNPGIRAFAETLVAHPPVTPEFRSYPTTATLVVDFQGSKWADLVAGEGSVSDFVRFDGH